MKVRNKRRDPEVLTLTQAVFVGVSDNRLKAKVAAGRLAGRMDRTWRFARGSLIRWLEERPTNA